ncbi:MAG: amidohydrolase family protein [Candidatus Microthrix sp.]|uniref:amidohydrolase family protein n=1 Tax=Candidatus Neomicrothrix sp. TaxID=2719034 RepID=UPI0025C1AF74|nr:amidohydrolase family protein [Candidatus Microthrix sp.]MBL0203141.1 amidohydrolase family protein [Candidatus Microthrix sp.]
MNEATTMVATNVKVFDGVHEELVEGHVVVSGSKIVEVTETMPSTGDDVEVIDGDGRVLMPGLTDAHCHIMGMCHSLPAMMQGDIGWIYANTVAAAERTLMRGFTTVRDAGGPVFGIKQAIDLGTIPGPRIYPSGAMISQTAGHGDFSMTYDVATALGGVPTRGDSVGMTLVADGPTGFSPRTRAAEEGCHADQDDGRRRCTSAYDSLDSAAVHDGRDPQAVNAAADWGTYVLSHVYNVEGIHRAIDAGVRSIEHAHLADEDTVKHMKDKNIWLSTQPFVSHDHHFPTPHPGQARAGVFGNRQPVRRSKKYGVNTAFGTDILLGFRQGNPPDHHKRLSEFMEPIEAVRMATSTNAELFRMCGLRDPYIDAPIGVVKPGAWADFLLVDGDPTMT